jgi:ubiquinone/menaquinone biosynthesis C-methylase UbiE
MSDKLSLEEVERLGYYDFMGYMGVPFFNIGGRASIARLAELCHITGETRILEVGCGTGTNACYLAEKYGCTVVGIDLAEHMVEQANKRAAELGLSDRATFKVGDAYHLDFPDATFDAVISIFVSQFLDPAKAFPEFSRVLGDGGRLGVNEMYRAENVPPEIKEKVDDSEKAFCELTELPFTLRSPPTWRQAFKSAGFADVTLEEHPNSSQRPYSGNIVEEFGGWRKLAGTLWRLLVYALMSGEMRRRFAEISRAKRILLKDNETSKYIGYVLAMGTKNPNKR